MPDRYTPELKDRVVEMYADGVKAEDIAAEVGIPRPTVYLILKQRGHMPSRQKVMQSRQLTVEQVLEQLSAAQRTIGRLEAENERLILKLERLEFHSDRQPADLPPDLPESEV